MQPASQDVAGPQDCVKEGNLPGAAHPFPDGAKSPADHLRNVGGKWNWATTHASVNQGAGGHDGGDECHTEPADVDEGRFEASIPDGAPAVTCNFCAPFSHPPGLPPHGAY